MPDGSPKSPKRPKAERTCTYKLDDAARAFVVTSLATYRGYAEIERDLQERGFDIARQSLHHYHPEHYHGRLAQKWVDLFHTTRKKFLEDVGSLPIAHRSARLRQLQTALDKCMVRLDAAKGDDFLAASAEMRSILEQGAKEMGGLLTNVRKTEGTVEHVVTTPEERRNMLEDRLAEAIARAKQAKGAGSKPTVQ